MLDTSNKTCRCIASLLVAHGVRDAVVSPGSRNAPLLMAFSRQKQLNLISVVDERSAGFVALGMAVTSGRPVALVCTSGSALLNYGPAVAEAYYRRVPLIVISADRPVEWIGQDDSQTIVQPGALSGYVKRSYDLPADSEGRRMWYENRLVNDALITAISGRRGPVHINVQIAEPINGLSDNRDDACDRVMNRVVSLIRPATSFPTSEARALGSTIASPVKVMIVAGFLPPDKTLNKAMLRLSNLPNFVVLTETISNLHGDRFISAIDAALASIPDDKRDRLKPDVVITTGGALVSRHIKQYLRQTTLTAHWHVGEIDDTVDCLQQLSCRIEMPPAVFFSQLASAMQPHKKDCDFARDWSVQKNRARSLTDSFGAQVEWSDFKAFATFVPKIPRNWNVHFSNGTSIRYAQIFGHHEYHRCECNRGVSGIDGCTSTAVGGMLAYRHGVTLLVSGDMSALYDLAGLTGGLLTARFKMIIINNSGGGIFRFIGATSELDIRENLLCCPSEINFAAVASSLGMACFTASNEHELRKVFPVFSAESERAALLVISTPAIDSADCLKDFFKFCKTR